MKLLENARPLTHLMSKDNNFRYNQIVTVVRATSSVADIMHM